jgi:hypothetical protein
MAVTQIKNGFQGGSDDQLLVNPDGSINVNATGGGGGSNASVGPVNSPAPASATEVAGVNPEGKLTHLSVTDSGALNVVTSGSSTVSGTVTTDVSGLNTFQTSQYTIGTSPVQITPSPLANRSSISLTVIAAANVSVYIGNNSGVTTSNGYPLYNGSTIQLDLTPSGMIWAVTAVAGQTIAALEIA